MWSILLLNVECLQFNTYRTPSTPTHHSIIEWLKSYIIIYEWYTNTTASLPLDMRCGTNDVWHVFLHNGYFVVISIAYTRNFTIRWWITRFFSQISLLFAVRCTLFTVVHGYFSVSYSFIFFFIFIHLNFSWDLHTSNTNTHTHIYPRLTHIYANISLILNRLYCVMNKHTVMRVYLLEWINGDPLILSGLHCVIKRWTNNIPE